MNNWSDWNDPHPLSDLGQLGSWRCTRESRGPCWNTDIRSSLLVVRCFLPCLAQLASSSTAFNQFTNRRPRESRVHIYTGCHYACSLVLLLAQQKPHPYNKCEVLSVCVHTPVGMGVWVGGRGGGEGAEYLPRGYDNVAQGRQWTARRQQTCQDRKGLTVQSEQVCLRLCLTGYTQYVSGVAWAGRAAVETQRSFTQIDFKTFASQTALSLKACRLLQGRGAEKKPRNEVRVLVEVFHISVRRGGWHASSPSCLLLSSASQGHTGIVVMPWGSVLLISANQTAAIALCATEWCSWTAHRSRVPAAQPPAPCGGLFAAMYGQVEGSADEM